MAEDDKSMPQPLFCRDLSWDPFRGWPQRSRMFDQDFGMPPFPVPCDPGWRQGTSSWPGYTRAPLFSSSAQTALLPAPALQHPPPGGVSEILTGQDRWQVNLDVKHFSPEEISIKTREGHLEITGKHEERQDEHGFVSRYFTRKYKLPAGTNLEDISSSLSGDGVLSVEGALPPSCRSAEIVIPIQVGEKPESSDCNEKEDLVAVEAKTEETTGGEEREEQRAGNTEELQTPPTEGPSNEPEGGDQPQEAPAAQSESSVEQGEELQADSSEVPVEIEERAAVSGGEEVPTDPKSGAGEGQVDPKPAEEAGEVGKELQEDQATPDAAVEGHPSDLTPETEHQQDAGEEPVQKPQEPSSTEGPLQETPEPASTEEPLQETPEPASTEEPLQETPEPASTEEPLQETPEPASTEEPLQETPEPASTEEPQPGPSLEAASLEQDIPEQQEILQVEFIKGLPEP